MQLVSAVKAQTRFGELIDQAQRETIAVTRYGRTIAYVVSEHEMRELQVGLDRRKKASTWLRDHAEKVRSERAPGVANPTDTEMAAIAEALRN